ncbi:2Fe-2S iron-sulfur cluster-binding protein [Novosphingobium sp. M1R2S20]|uniref:2Fe-2S iron-sulfur cluster-binding protein n=1 Tax=Novosphingobium rhizovicinum TaxID=3228928 RepID=A0ABV3R847_9SPHN
MPKVTYVTHDGRKTEVDVPVGENIMRGALYNGIEEIVGECGGGLSCATCHCYIDEEWTDKVGPPPLEAEAELLESAAAEIRPNSRLSCQVDVTEALDGLVIHMPETQY